MSIRLLLILFYLFSALIVFWVLNITNNYGAAVRYREVGNSDELFANFIYGVVFVYATIFTIFKLITFRKVKFVQLNKLVVLDAFLLLSIIINLFTLKAGIGKAGGEMSSIGFLQSIIPLIPLISFYYISVRDSITKQRIVLILASLVIGILKGWSGHLIVIVLLEVMYRFGERKISLKDIFKLFFAFSIVVFLFYFIVALKFYIRSGHYQTMLLYEYMQYVFGRTSYFATFNYILEVGEPLSEIIKDDRGMLFFIQEFFLGVVPKSIFGLSDFRFMDNIYSVNFIDSNLPNAGFSITLPGLYVISWYINNDFIFLTLFLVSIFYLQWCLMNVFNPTASKDLLLVNILLFCSSGSLKEIALFTYTLLSFLIFYMVFSFIIPFKKRFNNKIYEVNAV
ncbi:oligosaccharide repeat unit polymerase [Parasalinivibrio latis]|uniref:oligosaccharide repeat unit polymerase n=1 Tax=Parasalinivibrio latis TaxID=2952610 RepID=UPI0030E06944